MPEFEEPEANTSQSEQYTPSVDASKKPRTRRRSGGFKTEVASMDSSKMGEVNPAEALKKEKLSGSGSPSKSSEAPKERRERKPRERAERPERAERSERAERKPRESKAAPKPRTDANPQPSPETLAAIASVEAKIAERRKERDARRAEREKNRPAKVEGAQKKRPNQSVKKPAAKKAQGGLLASIAAFFGKLFGGSKPAPQKKGGQRNGNRGGRPQNRGGKRDGGQNRSGGNRGGNGNKGGRGRKRGGKGPRRDDRRNNENGAS